jgi:putative photosynthetic complex assembly protein
MSAIDAQPFPRSALYAAAALVAASLVLVGGVRLDRLLAPEPPAPLSARSGVVVLERSLAFSDGADGALVVRDAQSRALLTLRPGTEGFVRGVGRALARTRRTAGLGPEAGVFTLRAHADGALWLRDEANGAEVELSGFGADNRAAFQQFLPAEKE